MSLKSAPAGLRLLSLDGGGIRGLSGLFGIKEIMDRLRFDLRLETAPKPCNYFDMAVGSGTGGFIVILICRLGFTVEESITYYLRIAAIAFSTEEISKSEKLDKLKTSLEDVVRDAGLSATAKMNDTDSNGGTCKTFVCAMSASNVGHAHLLRSYDPRTHLSYNCTIVEAALLCLAYPGLLDPIRLGNAHLAEDLYDASFGCNNPVNVILKEAQEIFGNSAYLSLIISFGSGKSTISISQPTTGQILRDMVPALSQISLASEIPHNELQRRTQTLGVYFRFNTEYTVDSLALEEWLDSNQIAIQTRIYLQDENNNQRLDSVVEAMIARSNTILLATINTLRRAEAPARKQTLPDSESMMGMLALTNLEKPHLSGVTHGECLTGTRISIIQVIKDWANAKFVPRSIFWLRDIAGSGKSTVATTMANEWKRENRLASSFFFCISDEKVSSVKIFCSTIARDLHAWFPTSRSKIQAAINADSSIVTRTFQEQFTKLVIDPLLELDRTVLLVVDAVDECSSKEERKLLLETLVLGVKMAPNLRILITSRPEADLDPRLLTTATIYSMEFRLQDTTYVSNVEDIKIYINHHLADLVDSQGRQKLVEKADGLFIWASTARRLIEETYEDPGTVLSWLMSADQANNLDSLYESIISRALPSKSAATYVGKILSVLSVAYEPLSITTLQAFVPGRVSDLIQKLGSVLTVKDDGLVRFRHPTFRDFLLKQKSSDIPLNIPAAHALVAQKAFTFLDELKQNILGLQDSPSNTEVEDIAGLLNKATNQSKVYSAKYCFFHTSKSLENRAVAEAATKFFKSKLLQWLELMSWSESIVLGLDGLFELQCSILASREAIGKGSLLKTWVAEALKFTQSNQTTIERSALQVYLGALVFSPSESLIHRTYSHLFPPNSPKVLSGRPEEWPRDQVLTGNTRPVVCVAFSQDGKYIASASESGTIYIWNTQSGAAIIKPIVGNDDRIAGLSFSSNGDTLLSWSYDGELTRWSTFTGACLGTPLRDFYSSQAYIFTFSPNGNKIFFPTPDHTVIFWDMENEAMSETIYKSHPCRISCLTVSVGDSQLAAGHTDGTVTLWDISSIAPVRLFNGLSGVLLGTAISPLGNRIAANSFDRVLVWSLDSGEVICAFPRTNHIDIRSTGLAFSSDGHKLLSGQEIRDPESGTIIFARPDTHYYASSILAISPDGSKIVMKAFDHSLRITDSSLVALPQNTPVKHQTHVWSLAISPDAKSVLSGSADGTIRIWDSYTGACSKIIDGIGGYEIRCIAISPDGSKVVAGCYAGRIIIFETESGDAITPPYLHSPWAMHNGPVVCVAFSPGGSIAVSGSTDSTLRILEAQTGEARGAPLQEHTLDISCLAFSKDDKYFVSGSWDGSLRVWDTETGETVGSPFMRDHEVVSVAYSPDGKAIIAGYFDQEICIWDLDSSDGSMTAVTFSMKGWADLSFSPESTMLHFRVGSDQGFPFQSFFVELFHGDQPPSNSEIQYSFELGAIHSPEVPKYRYMLPPDTLGWVYKAYKGIIVFGCMDGRVMIIDCRSLLT